MSPFPLPPQDEWDGDRHVHPYVRSPHPDTSAPGYRTTGLEDVTQEDRSRESRLAFHTIEPLLGHLTPLGMAHLIDALKDRLHPPAVAEAMAEQGISWEQIDPRGEILPFAEIHEHDLQAIHDAIERIVMTCPNCGRHHGKDCDEALQPGPYVNTATGDSVNAVRVTASKVYVKAQIDASGRQVDRTYDREWFEAHMVPADHVAVLTSDGQPA